MRERLYPTLESLREMIAIAIEIYGKDAEVILYNCAGDVMYGRLRVITGDEKLEIGDG